MSLLVKHIPPQNISSVWDIVEPFIQDALEKGSESKDHSLDYNSSHVQLYLSKGEWMLLVAMDSDGLIRGCATVSFINYPMHRVAFITAIGGKLISSKETFEQMKTILGKFGVTKLQGYARKSVVRLWERFNFKPINTLIEVKI
tara:strand:+ start:233 stop:664 length:432 start_codon:yes stop_codon:yes gene_type:complete